MELFLIATEGVEPPSENHVEPVQLTNSGPEERLAFFNRKG